MNGSLHASVAVLGGASRVVTLSASPPLAAKVLAGPNGPELMVVGAAAGLLEGDTIRVEVDLAPGACLTVRSTAATLAHPCPGGGATATSADLRLGEGARLVWAPEPLVACARCHHTGTALVHLAPGAACVWYEALTLGRSGEEAGPVEVRLDAVLAGVPLLRDALRAGPPSTPSPAVLGRHRHAGAVHLLGARPTRPAAPGEAPHLALAGPGSTVRAVADDAETLRQRLAPALCSFIDLLHDRHPREALSHA